MDPKLVGPPPHMIPVCDVRLILVFPSCPMLAKRLVQRAFGTQSDTTLRGIGHGLAAQSDERLIRQLANDRVMIELCPTSNLLLGHVSDLKDHPARRFFDAGIPITFNTDDPGIFRTSLLEEYEVAVHTLGFSLDDLAEISRKASEFALVDEVDVRSLKGQNLRAI